MSLLGSRRASRAGLGASRAVLRASRAGFGASRAVLRALAALLLLLGGVAQLLGQSGAGAKIETQVVLVGEGSRDASPAEAVVAWEPATATPASTPRPGTFELATRDKAFEPSWLVVPAGSTVRFPNHDPILHNVFSVSPGNAFDVGLYGRGEGEKAVLAAPGVVRVFCNVHRQMYSHVLVLATRWFAHPDASGKVRLEGLPAGRGRLLLWHERTDVQARELSSPSAAPAVLQLDLTRRRVPPHFNKLGRPYDRRDRYGD